MAISLLGVFRVAAAGKFGENNVPFVPQFTVNSECGGVIAIHGHQFQSSEKYSMGVFGLGSAAAITGNALPTQRALATHLVKRKAH